MIYDDINVMLRDVIGFMRSTGLRVLSDDDPQGQLIGFTSETTLEGCLHLWDFPVKKLKDQDLSPELREDLLSVLSRKNLATKLWEKSQEGVHSHV